MDFEFEEEFHVMELVQTTLMKMGLMPTLEQIGEKGPIVLSSVMHEDDTLEEVGTYAFNSTEPKHGEIAYLFTLTLDAMTPEDFMRIVSFCNLVHQHLTPLGTAYMSHDEERGGCYLNYRFVFPLDQDVSESCRQIRHYFTETREFFEQMRWATMDLATGGDIQEAFDMLSIGETHASA